jgi:hypothetical protein
MKSALVSSPRLLIRSAEEDGLPLVEATVTGGWKAIVTEARRKIMQSIGRNTWAVILLVDPRQCCRQQEEHDECRL